jgi:predicted DsbA family dithiol-disulfide isomerase
MEATCWSDYLCPWCYIGQARSALLERLGVPVVHLPYELHPEIPAAGRRIRADGRLQGTFARVGEACEEAGLPWRPPERMPNTRRALETAEWVRLHHPEAESALHGALFDAHFARGLEIDDPEVLDALVLASGAPADEVRSAVDAGHARPPVDAAMAAARAIGVTSTPTWVLDDGFQVPGALDAATFERWITKILHRRNASPVIEAG